MSSTPARTRAALSRERIVRAAAEIVDEQGVDALSMRAVATRLGSGVMSLYRHVTGHEELLDLVLAAMTAEIELPEPTGQWREDLRAAARAMRAALLRRPRLTLLLTARAGRGAGELVLVDRVLGVLRTAGLSPREAVLVNHALGNLVAGAALWEATGLGGAAGADRTDRLAEVHRVVEAAGEDLPHLAWARGELLSPDLDERFEAALDLVVAGAESWID